MPYNLLVFPLAGGYFILLNFAFFKFKYQRLDSQRILINSIIAGIFLLTFSVGLRFVCEELFPRHFHIVYRFLIKILSFRDTPFLWTAIFSFFIAVVFTEIANAILYKWNFFGYESALSRAVRKHGDEIEQLFRNSAIKGELMQISLKNGKVYVGFADVIPVPQETNYMKILPVLSGYRNGNTHEITYSTQYLPVYEELKNNGSRALDLDWNVVIKQDEIISAGVFDMDVSELFIKNRL